MKMNISPEKLKLKQNFHKIFIILQQLKRVVQFKIKNSIITFLNAKSDRR